MRVRSHAGAFCIRMRFACGCGAHAGAARIRVWRVRGCDATARVDATPLRAWIQRAGRECSCGIACTRGGVALLSVWMRRGSARGCGADASA
eukprot:6172319-Pleurochrysis_carterae.AAC.3